MEWHRSAFASAASPVLGRGRTAVRHRRVARCGRRVAMAADPLPPTGGGMTNDEEVAAKRSAARAVRQEAERMKMMAEKARLESQGAELVAERKKLEVERLKLSKEAANLKERESLAAKSPDPQSPLTSLPATTPTPSSNIASSPSASDSTPTVEENTSKDKSPSKDFEVTLTLEIPSISEDDIQELKKHVFSMDTFFVTEIERAPLLDRAVFRGNLRAEPRVAFEALLTELDKRELKDRIRLFLMEDPGEGRKPVIVALPAEAETKKPGIAAILAANVIVLFSAVTVLGYAVGVFDLSPEMLQQLGDGDELLARDILSIPSGILGIVAAHEIGHRVMGKLRDIKVDLPYVIPSLQIGCFGTITPLLSFPKDRSALFDFAVAGPIAGVGCSIAALVAGLSMTAQGLTQPWFPTIATDLFRSSLLVGSIANAVLPEQLLSQTSLSLHPMAIVGYTGLLINALNLIPVGRLDGGRIVQSLFGRVTASAISISALLLELVSSSLGNSPLLLWWAGLSLLLQRDSEIPCQDELTEPDNGRSALGLFMLFIMLATLVPFPEGLRSVAELTGTQI